MNLIDLFAGCGGMSTGFEMAGFDVVLASELDAWAAETYHVNHPETTLITGDVKNVSDWTKLLTDQSPITGVIGGPPCQGFSLSGNRDPKDPRNSLFMEFVKCVKQTEPAFFVMENVLGLRSMRTASGETVVRIIMNEFRTAGYDVFPEVINAADCGVPQTRQRLFFVGFKASLQLSDQFAVDKISKSITTDMAISDLPTIGAGEGVDCQEYPVPPQNAYQAWIREGSSHITSHVAMRHTERLIERFKVIPQGCSVADVPQEYSAVKRGDASVKSGKVYSQNNMRVRGDRPCPTVTASFQSNFVHPWLSRNFTAREGARLQSFPDKYLFSGKRTKMSWEKGLSQYQQIGNAVPPLMAKAVAKAVLKILTGKPT